MSVGVAFLGRLGQGVCLGAVGGLMVGGLISAIGSLSSTSGAQGIRWRIVWFEAAFYGIPPGVLLYAPAFVYLRNRKVNLKTVILVPFVGTALGGVVGMLVTPLMAYWGAVTGALVSCALLDRHLSYGK